jgi:hypothetical protein
MVKMTIEHWGHFTLTNHNEGFRWEFTSPAGGLWHWDPIARLWTGKGRWSRTPEEASAGLDLLSAQCLRSLSSGQATHVPSSRGQCVNRAFPAVTR